MEILISGASTGIGRASAVHMARKGHSVWAGVRTEKSFEEIKKLNVQGLKPLFLDVTEQKSVDAALSTIKKNSGMLNAVVNNAGIAVAGPFEGLPIEEWRRQLDVNVLGPVRLTQACLPLLRQSKGRVVNVSSISGKVASHFLGPYTASKFALEALSDSLRREVKGQGVKVSIIEPGPIATPIWNKSRTDESKLKYSKEVEELYGTAMDKFRKYIDESERSGAPVAIVVSAIEHALTARSPRTRYPVGRGIKLTSALAGTLPDTWLDRLVLSKR